MRGKFSKWCSAGVDIAERVSIKEEITSVEAGWMVTRFADRRRAVLVEEEGNERRCFSLGRREVRAGIMGEEAAMVVDQRSRRRCSFRQSLRVSLLQGSWPWPQLGHLRAEAADAHPNIGSVFKNDCRAPQWRSTSSSGRSEKVDT